MNSPAARLDAWLEFTARGATVGGEIRGGIVTFATMAYIIVLNPLIIGTARDIEGNLVGGADSPAQAIAMVTAATALVAGVTSILMGGIGRFPMAVAAGLGLSGFVASTLAPTMTWPDVMGLVVLEGLVILSLVLLGLRKAVFDAVPTSMKYAMSVGIGMFVTLIGLVDAGIVRAGPPALTLGIDGTLDGWPTLTFLVGLLVMVVLVVRRTRAAILIGIVAATAFAVIVQSFVHQTARGPTNPTGWGLNVPEVPRTLVSAPDLGLLGQFSLFGGFQAVGLAAALVALFSLVLPDFFDTMGTAYALASEAELLEDGHVPHMQSILIVDSVAASAGGAASVSSNTTFVESASGIGDGARTGLAAMVTGALFLIAMFLTPLVAIIPYESAAPALVVVGAIMMAQVRHIDFRDPAIGIPAFVTIVLMPFTYSITNGIGAGLILYVTIRVFTGKAREVTWPMWVLSATFLAYFTMNALQTVSGLG